MMPHRVLNADPIRYFRENSFTESLVLSIDHNPESATLRIVVDPVDLQALAERFHLPAAAGSATPVRDFHELVFSGIGHVQRKDTLYRAGFLGFDPRDLSLPPERRLNVVIEAVEILSTSAGWSATITMGSLGEYRFEFQALHVARRLGRGVKCEGPGRDWFDAETGEPFDLHRPFPLCPTFPP